MNQNDISQILPSPQENNNPFIELNFTKSNKPAVQSKVFQKIFYKKRSMKDLLQQRTTLCLELGLTSSRKSFNPINREQLAQHFCSIFSDGPSLLNQVSWTIVEDRGTIYGFLATEQKYVPHCKFCNFTVYVSMRGKSGRIVCSNSKCKTKLLSEFEIELSEMVVRDNKGVQNRSQKAISRVQQKQVQKVQTNLQERQLIKRAAKRIIQ